MKRVLRVLAALLAPCALPVLGLAQSVFVSVQASYTDGLLESSLSIGDPINMTLSGAALQSDARQVEIMLDEPLLITLVAQALTRYQVGFTPPSGYGVMIDGVRQSAYVGTGSATIKVTLVRESSAAADDLPTGEPSSIQWLPPTHASGPPRWPFIAFNLGAGKNGLALPQLRIPLARQFPASPPLPSPDSPEVSRILSSDGALFLSTPQADVRLRRDPASSGNFTMTFFAPGTSTVIVAYSFEFPLWQGEGSDQLKRVRVVRQLPGAASTETSIEGYFSDAGIRPVNGTWTIEDWHRSTEPTARVLLGTRTRALTGTGSVDYEYRVASIVTDTVEIKPSRDSAIVAARTTHTYNDFIIGEHPDVFNVIMPRDTTEGVGDGNYTTLHHFTPNQDSVRGTTSPTGAVSLSEETAAYPSGQHLHATYDTWLDTSPALNAAPGGTPVNPNGSRQTLVWREMNPLWAGFQWPQQVEQRAQGTLLARRTFAYAESNGPDQHTIVTVVRRDFFTAASSHETVIKRYRPDAADLSLRDQIYSVQSPTGAKESFAYQSGTFVGAGNAWRADFRIIRLSGTAHGGTGVSRVEGNAIDPLGLHANQSTMTTDYLRRGRLVRREVRIFIGGGGENPVFNSGDPVAWETCIYEADPAGEWKDGRLVSRISSTGASYSATWSGTRKTSQQDETGLVTTFGHDAMDRIISIDRPAVGSLPARRTTFDYDAAHRLRVRREIAPTGEQIVTETEYDRGGRVKRLRQPGQGTLSAAGTIVTDFAYANGGRDVQTSVSAIGASRLVTCHVDGRVKSITGTAVVPEFYTYDFDGASRARVTRRLGSQQRRPGSTVFDLLGRPVEERIDGFGPGGSQKPLVTHHVYDSASGLLRKTFTLEQSTGFRLTADRLFNYDAFGRLTATGLDLNRDGVLQAASNDRLEEYAFGFVNENGGWWRRHSRKIYPTDHSTAFLEERSDTRLTGLAGKLAESIAVDIHGNTTSRSLLAQPASRSHRLLLRQPDSTTLEQTLVGGLLVSERWFDDNDPALTGSPTLATGYTYDSLGRLSHTSDARTGPAETRYWHGTALPREQYDARASFVRGFGYDPAGRLATLTNPVGSVSYTYTPRSELDTESGSGTHPSRRTYTEYGELKELRTYRNGLAGSADVTTWTYDDNTGWLVARTDAAGQLESFDYTFEPEYRNVYRHSARNPGAPTRSRYALATGALVKIDYSDGTPDVDFLSYDRLGNPRQVQDATGVRTFAYQNGQLVSESLSPWFNQLVFTRDYQPSTNPAANTVKGRFFRWQLGTPAQPGREMSSTFAYDHFGRIAGVTAYYPAQGSRPELDVPATYSYRSHSSHWETLSQGDFTVVRAFEPARDVLTSITSQHTTGGPLAGFVYSTDSAGRREWSRQSGMAFDDFVDVASDATYYRYSYNAAGELESARGFRGLDPTSEASPLPGRGFGFAYDTAGNRKSVSVSGENAPYWDGPNASGNLGANPLNQPLSRRSLRTRVSGTSHKNATVTVAGTTAVREATPGRYWDAALPGYGQSASLDVTATLSGQTQTGSVQVLTRPATETFAYDSDGNLTSDALWRYEWDAENRLKRMYTDPAAIAWGAPKRELLFTYDYLGRRVGKISRLNDNTVHDRKYLYVGWNLVAEFDTTTNKIVRSYLWGLDLDSTPGGMGGVGGLLLTTVHTDAALAPHHVCFDGSGNVTALVTRKPNDDSNGTVAATYEYGPFGENVRTWIAPTLSAVLKDALAQQPFRFSTKFTDTESGLVYYGHRYYDPTQGRFINRDPIAEAGGLNLYAFVGNNPINRVDYLGLESTPTVKLHLFPRFIDPNAPEFDITTIGGDSTETPRHENDASLSRKTAVGTVFVLNESIIGSPRIRSYDDQPNSDYLKGAFIDLPVHAVTGSIPAQVINGFLTAEDRWAQDVRDVREHGFLGAIPVRLERIADQIIETAQSKRGQAEIAASIVVAIFTGPAASRAAIAESAPLRTQMLQQQMGKQGAPISQSRLADLQTKFERLAEEHLLPKYRAIDPNLKAGYTGSFKTGTVGNPTKSTFGQPVNLSKFDIDYWIKSDAFFDKMGPNLRADVQFRKILSETPGFEGLKPNKAGFSIKFGPSLE